MIGKKRVLVLIQARAGSTKVKDKNIADLNGKPVLWYSVSEALKSRFADAVCVSTDSPKYARIAEDAGVKVPFLRPAALSTGDTTSAASARWAVLAYEKFSGKKYDYVVEFMCTNPLKTAADLDACIEKLDRTGADSVVAVVRLWDHHPQRIKIIENDEIQDWPGVPEILESKRQDLKPAAYLRCGSIYALKRSVVVDEKNRRGKVSRPYVMPEERVINIDEPLDLLTARALMERRDGPDRGPLGLKLLVTANLDGIPDVLDTLGRIGEVDYRPRMTVAQLAKAAHRYDALFISTQLLIDAKVLKKTPGSRLKAVCSASTGRDHIDLAAAKRAGIAVLSITTDFDTLKTITSTAENAFNLLMNCARKTVPAFEHVRRGGWDYTKFLGLELNGKTVGVVGFGRLGTIFTRFCLAFNMRVLAYDPKIVIHNPDVTQVKDLDRLLAESDFVSLHVHLGPDTRHMIGAAQFARMKRTSYLVNTARGGVLDQAALVEALEKKLIAGAGIDVIEGEIEGEVTRSVAASKKRVLRYARTHDNLLITPHISGMSDGGRRKAFNLAARKLYAHMAALTGR